MARQTPLPTAPAPPPIAPTEPAGWSRDGSDAGCSTEPCAGASGPDPRSDVAVGRAGDGGGDVVRPRSITDNNDLTSAGTMSVAIRTAAPIAMCGLGGLYAERSGTVNIGLEGMMILGTVFGGWWGWEYGPWMALLGGAVGGLFGGLLLALVTTTFGVNHIVAGFAINILAPGHRPIHVDHAVRRRAGRLAHQLTRRHRRHRGVHDAVALRWRVSSARRLRTCSAASTPGTGSPVSDIAGVLKGLTSGVRYDVLVGVGLFAASVFLLWHTRFGLRLRSAGEHPSAADSLGVRVHLFRYTGAAISGSLAGLGGAMLVISAGRYSQGQTVGKGFLGLATLVVGNWRPVGVAIGASIFGFFDGITQRLSPENLAPRPAPRRRPAAVRRDRLRPRHQGRRRHQAARHRAKRVRHLRRAAGVVLRARRQRGRDAPLVDRRVGGHGRRRRLRAPVGGLTGAIMAMAAVAALFIYLRLDAIPDEFVPMLPYIVTLVVVSSRGQALRPPAAAGEPWFKGQQTRTERRADAEIVIPPRGRWVIVTSTEIALADSKISPAISAASASANTGRSRKPHR